MRETSRKIERTLNTYGNLLLTFPPTSMKWAHDNSPDSVWTILGSSKTSANGSRETHCCDEAFPVLSLSLISLYNCLSSFRCLYCIPINRRIASPNLNLRTIQPSITPDHPAAAGPSRRDGGSGEGEKSQGD
jgi:hypothetical protein